METLFKCGLLVHFESFSFETIDCPFSQVCVPSSVATCDHPVGGAMLSWPTKEICEVFEESKFCKMNNVLSFVIITKAMLRTCLLKRCF